MCHQVKHYEEFCTEMDTLSRRHDRARIFDDFLTLSLCCLHQTNLSSRLQETDPENEALYFETIKHYERPELDSFARLLGLIKLQILENPYDDLLGEYFMLHISRGRNGQFFTPEHVCAMMARLSGADEQPIGKRVYDPACGSGRLMLQFAKVAPDNYFYANDLSLTCAKMAALNFMLNGLRGEVACLNTLSWEWFAGWSINQPVLGIHPIEKENSKLWNTLPQLEVQPDNTQLALF